VNLPFGLTPGEYSQRLDRRKSAGRRTAPAGAGCQSAVQPPLVMKLQPHGAAAINLGMPTAGGHQAAACRSVQAFRSILVLVLAEALQNVDGSGRADSWAHRASTSRSCSTKYGDDLQRSTLVEVGGRAFASDPITLKPVKSAAELP